MKKKRIQFPEEAKQQQGPLMAEAAISTAPSHPLAILLAGQVLQGGEIIQLILRPSALYIILNSLKTIGCIIIALIACKIYDEQLPGPMRFYVEGAMFLIAGRLCVSTLQWFTRLYVLTDRRVLRMSGIFKIHVQDCPLRCIAVARLNSTTREKLARLGSIEIIPQDDHPVCVWQTIPTPREVLKILRSAIARSKHHAYPGN